MMTCRDVSTSVSSGGLSDEPLTRRLAVWLHLSMCRHCRAFWRQCRRFNQALRRAATQAGPNDAPAELAGRVYERLSRE